MDVGAILTAGWLLSLAGAVPDTTVDVRRGDRVVVEGLSGAVEVRSWDRPSLSVTDASGDVQDVVVRRVGGRLLVGSGDRKRRALPVELRIRVPSWAPLEVQGRALEVDVSGLGSEVVVRTVEGNILASAVSGSVVLSTVEGRVDVRDARGNISARSRGDDVTLVRVEGAVEAESGSGDLRLEDVTASSVRAQTLDGDLYFRGALARGGTYWFSVHDGDADLVVPAGTGARARVATFDGEFVSDFPVTLQRYGGGGMFEFTLGDGAASLEIQVFDGEIRLRSGGE